MSSNVYLSPTQTSSQSQSKSTVDPIAQSFIVDTIGGAFITSIDLYFATKDPTLPVTLEIREMENGIPTGIIIPNSTVTVQSQSVVTSTNATLPTRFTFSSPIYLLDTAEYCFVVIANSKYYKIWVAEIGKNDVTNSAFSISKQPYSGVMFKAQNSGVWIAEQNLDIKFVIRRAEFVTSGTLVLNETRPSTPIPVKLDTNPIYTYATVITPTNYVVPVNGNPVTCNIASTSALTTGDKLTISGATETNLNGSWTITVTSGTSFTFTTTAAASTGTYTSGLGTALIGSKKVRVFQKNHGHIAGSSSVIISGLVDATYYNGIPGSELNGTHASISNVEQDSYTFEVTTASTAAGRVGGSSVTATENKIFDILYPNIQQLTFKDTNINWTAQTRSAKSLAGTSQSPLQLSSAFKIPINQNIEMKAPQMIRGVISNTDKDLYITGNISTTSNTLSPMIDLTRTSAIGVSFRLDRPTNIPSISDTNYVENYRDETIAVGTSALSKYITRRVDLATAAKALRIFLSTNRPSGSYIDVYYKVTENIDENFDSLPWYLVSPIDSVPINNNPSSYDEVEYAVTETMSGIAGKSFVAFAVKIVFTSTNSSAAPSCADLRVIAIT